MGRGSEGCEMERVHPFLRLTAHSLDNGLQISGDRRGTSTHSTDEIDVIAVLDASQALSSETNLDRLMGRVVKVLGAMTGATSVRMVVWDVDEHRWFLASPSEGGAGRISVERAGELGLLPLSAFRYAERTREPLLVPDATTDDRFSRDPYVAGLPCCSLLVVPIFAQGAARAVLLLENQLSRGAFSAHRLDAVTLIAGQLAVSLDNALVYDSADVADDLRRPALDDRRVIVGKRVSEGVSDDRRHQFAQPSDGVAIDAQAASAAVDRRAAKHNHLPLVARSVAHSAPASFADDQRAG